ncbi:coiled-coil domain-containing protein 34 [Colossoma macropomum]|uniref:coiled-coil domain-containing protein 34 n=1 Tax=Colossoma macropomum TaxID=42526 RepID=UPI0018645800|nr:coiled-coil domain-containing protein 34 [Colossoma macropomum]
MSALQSASSKSFTSTPLKSKSAIPRSIPRSKSVESTGDSTYSLLSPIYHDSFDFSDEDNEEAPKQYQPADNSSLTVHEDGLSVSHSRNETLESLCAQNTSTGKLNLSAWEQWVVSKAKEERMKMQQKTLEQEALKEKKAKEETEQQRKKAVSECKIQEWLQMKKEQEKHEKFCRESQKTKKMLYEEQKRLEIERKAQEKYKEWLRQKKQEEMVRKLEEQEEIARGEKEERERKERAEEKFKEWLKNIKDKDRHKRQLSACPAGGYNNLNYPSPTFVNPIPWKPIHIPQQNSTPRKNLAHKKQPGLPKYQSTPCFSYKPKDTFSFACKRR